MTAARYLVFVADGFEEGPADIEGLRPLLPAADREAELVDSTQWYDKRMPVCGSVASWAAEAVTGRDYWTREPHFRGFIVQGGPSLPEEAATTIEVALKVGKPVLALDDGTLRRVRRIHMSPRGEGTIELGDSHG